MEEIFVVHIVVDLTIMFRDAEEEERIQEANEAKTTFKEGA